MILSAQQTFSDAQALTATAVSTNVIDLGATGTVLNGPAALERAIGKGTPIPIYITLDVAAGGTSPTIVVELQQDTVEGFGSATTLSSTESKAGGAAGDRLTLYVLPQNITERYLRLNFVLGGTTPTYTVTAAIVLADQTNDTVPGAA